MLKRFKGKDADQKLEAGDRQAPLSWQGGGCGGAQTGDRGVLRSSWRSVWRNAARQLTSRPIRPDSLFVHPARSIA
jgi:hypothetical protein